MQSLDDGFILGSCYVEAMTRMQSSGIDDQGDKRAGAASGKTMMDTIRPAFFFLILERGGTDIPMRGKSPCSDCHVLGFRAVVFGGVWWCFGGVGGGGGCLVCSKGQGGQGGQELW